MMRNLGDVIKEALDELEEVQFYSSAVNIAHHAAQVYKSQGNLHKSKEFYDKTISLSRLHYQHYKKRGDTDICNNILKEIKDLKTKRNKIISELEKVPRVG